MNPRNVAKLLLPPILLEGWKKIQNRKRDVDLNLNGDYSSWIEALHASTGYDTELILEKSKSALLKVKRGEAIYERDSVLFNEIQHLATPRGLKWVAAQITKTKSRLLQKFINSEHLQHQRNCF